MTNTSKKIGPSSPGKPNSPAKASTPPRKSNANRSPLKLTKSAKDQQIRYKEIGIPGVCLAFAFKPDGVNPSFMGPLLRALDEDDTQKAAGHILFLTQARKTDGSNSIAQTPSMTGKLYPTDVVVMSVEDEDKSFVAVVDHKCCIMLLPVIVAEDPGSILFPPLLIEEVQHHQVFLQ